jgi:hypothetical protein
MKDIKVHPAAECVRVMDAEELASLAASIEAHGQRDPIVLGRVNGAASEMLVDGRNRLRACEMAHVEPRFEVMQFEDDEAVKAFVADKSEHRNISKGQKAMRIAWLWPEPDRRGRGHKGKALETGAFSRQRLQQARTVYWHSPEYARAVRDGSMSLDEALQKVATARKEMQSAEEQMTRVRADAPDLAELVDQGKLKLAEAIAALDERKRIEEEKEKNRREVTLRITADAYRSIVSWGNDEFVADTLALIDDPEFRRALIERVRADRQFLPNIGRGAKALFDLLSSLTER